MLCSSKMPAASPAAMPGTTVSPARAKGMPPGCSAGSLHHKPNQHASMPMMEQARKQH